MPRAQLSAVTLPEFGTPTVEPQLTRDIYRARIARLESRMAEAGLDAIVIYGDREHLANISWASGYDPRFEEALLHRRSWTHGPAFWPATRAIPMPRRPPAISTACCGSP